MTIPLVTRILIADDHAIVRSGLKKVLDAKPDMEVVAEAEDGHEAVEKALKEDVHLVILDVSMPRRSGLEVLEWMRARPAYHSLPVHVLSSSEEKSDIARAMALGAASYRTKKVGMADLEDTARKIVGLESARS